MTSTPRPFRFGLSTGGKDPWIDHVQRVEELGFDVLLMPDHFHRQLAIFPALTAAAMATSKLRVGTLVFQNDLRHPAMLAKEAATLDLLSGGRFELGLGAGGSYPLDFEWTGIPFDPPATRVSRLIESVQVLHKCFGGEAFSHDGEFFHFRDYQALPKPVQKPGIPFMIPGGGKRTLKFAAKHADIVGILPRMLPKEELDKGNTFDLEDITFEAFASKVAYVREHAGECSESIEFNILVQMFIVTDDREAEIARLRKEHPDLPATWFDSPMVFVGTIEQNIEKVRRVREETGISYFVVFEPVMEAFAPVVAALSGT